MGNIVKSKQQIKLLITQLVITQKVIKQKVK